LEKGSSRHRDQGIVQRQNLISAIEIHWMMKELKDIKKEIDPESKI